MDREYFFFFFCWHAKIGWVRGHAVMFKERRWIRAGRGMFYFLKKLGQPIWLFFHSYYLAVFQLNLAFHLPCIDKEIM